MGIYCKMDRLLLELQQENQPEFAQLPSFFEDSL
jgi:hypothetical protein